MKVSMVMIARNERRNVRPCFESFWDYVDEVVLVDTGSTDGTVKEARRFARERREKDKLVIGHFPWRDDFGAARDHAASLATGDVHVKLDLDERIERGRKRLRELAAEFVQDPDAGVLAVVHYGLTPKQPREFLYKEPVRWVGPTWEYVLHEGERTFSDLICLKHTRSEYRGRRDLNIALQWAEREPLNWYPLWAASAETWQVAVHEEGGVGTVESLERVRDLAERAFDLADETDPRFERDGRPLLLDTLAHTCYNLGDRSAAEDWARWAVSDVEPLPTTWRLLERIARDRAMR